MNLRTSLLAFGCFCVLVTLDGSPVRPTHTKKFKSTNLTKSEYEFGLEFLFTYGYLNNRHHLRTNDKLTLAILKFQTVYSLKKTGIFDDQTVKMMKKPRCGLSDNFAIQRNVFDLPSKSNPILAPQQTLNPKSRKKRYTLMGKWPNTEISYAFRSYTSDMTIKKQQQEIARALQVWSKNTPLTFVKDQDNADITISFEQGYHYDGYPFDGPGQTLAHAFYPGQGDKSGNVHFDAEETWTDGSNKERTSLFKVAVHEFGHALGLGHSNNKASVMLPFYQGTSSDASLGLDDQLAIYDLYGSNNRQHDFLIQDDPFVYGDPTLTSSTVGVKKEVDLITKSTQSCDYQFDAAANIREEVYFFKGNFFWRIERTGKTHSRIAMNRFWRQFPNVNVDAVYAIKDKILLFSGTQYWSYTNIQKDSDSPRNISDFGLPMTDGGIDAAVVWKANGMTYFYKGSQYWKYNEVAQRMEPNYPKPVRSGVPENIDAALTSPSDNCIYYLKDQKAYRLDNDLLSVDDDVEYIGVKWFGCDMPAFKESAVSPSERINNTMRESHVLSRPGGSGGSVRHVTNTNNLFFVFGFSQFILNVLNK